MLLFCRTAAPMKLLEWCIHLTVMFEGKVVGLLLRRR